MSEDESKIQLINGEDKSTEEDVELDGVFAFAIMAVDNGVYTIKPLEGYTDNAGNFIPYKFLREPTMDDLVTAVSLLTKKFEREALAKEIVGMIRNTPGKILVPKPGRIQG